MLDKFVYNPANRELGFTQSEISTLSNCGMKWNLLYNHCLKKTGTFSWALVVGDAFHDAMEQLYRNRGQGFVLKEFKFPIDVILTNNQKAEEHYWRQVLQAMIEAYVIYYKDDFSRWIYTDSDVEEEICIEYMGFKLRGKIDLRFEPAPNRGLHILDHKTTSKIDAEVTAGWDFRFQFMFYLWLDWKSGRNPRGFYTNAVKKPQLRRKNNGTEPVEEFAQRVRTDMIQEPEKYFYRDVLPISSGALKHFEDVVLAPKIARLQILEDSDSKYFHSAPEAQKAIALDMNTDECQRYGAPCQFIDLCRHGWDQHGFEFTQRPAKHEELGSIPDASS